MEEGDSEDEEEEEEEETEGEGEEQALLDGEGARIGSYVARNPVA